MPETAIHENSQLGFGKDEVRSARDRLMSAPTGNAVGSEQFGKRHLRVFVALAPDARHHLGALGLDEDVWQISSE